MAVVGVIGSYGGLNIGDEAILTSIIAELRHAMPEVEIVVFSRNAEYTRQHYEVARVVASREMTQEDVTPEVKRLDLLLLGGGGILFDAEVHHFLREVKIAQQHGVPTFAFALGAGPLETPEGRTLTREILNQMDGITVRELEAKRLLESIGVERDMTVTADPALLLTPEPFTEEMLSKEGVSLDRPLVGFSVREPGGAAPGLDESAYHKLLADAADFAVHRFDANILFVPMERGDVQHAHQVSAQMIAADRASVLNGTYTPRQILGLMQHLELVIGMRLHFLIFATTSSIPFLALPYASKVSSFVHALELPEQSMVQEERVGPFLASIDQLWDHKHEQQQVLSERVEALQEQARQTTKLVLPLIRR